MKKYLQKLLWKYALCLTSAFNTPSLLKSRIVMLYQKPSAHLALAKFGFVLPTLMLCMLITAFTQRERILPTQLLAETENVVQRLAGEAQKAFLPALTNEVITISEATEESLPTKNEGNVLMQALPTNKLIARGTEALHFVNFKPANILIPQKTEWKKPITVKDYTLLKTYYLYKDRISQRYPYIFTKNNTYIFQIVDAKSEIPIAGSNINVSIYAKRGDDLVPVAFEKTTDGIMFQCESTGMFELVFENRDKRDCIAVQLLFQRGFHNSSHKASEVFLADMAGKEINYKKKLSTKNELQLIFREEEASKKYEIKTVTVTHFRKRQTVASKTFANGTLDFEALKIKRGDAVQIGVSEVIDTSSNEKVKIVTTYISFIAK